MKDHLFYDHSRISPARRAGIVLIAVLLIVADIGTHLYQRATAEQNAQSLAGKVESANFPWPSYGEGAIGAVGYGVFATHGDETPMPTASVAKVMTALAVLKKMPLSPGQQGPTITITQQDWEIYEYYRSQNGSLVPVRIGEKITEYQALEALLLPSANNMADTLADQAFGSVDAYSNYANKLAKSLGMTHSDFSDASGYSPTTVSTAEDLVKLGEVALQNPVIAQIVNEKQATIPVAGTIDNVNSLLGTHGINGVKTGNNDQDKGAFMGARTVTLPNGRTVQLVSVVMGAPSLKKALNDSVPVLDTAAQNLVIKTVNTPSADGKN